MKLLMFGWEFPPFSSGGLGVACEGLTKALARQGLDITFVMPKKVDLNLDYMKLAFGDNKSLKGYYFNSPLNAYATSESYTETLTNEELESRKYCLSLIEEVERYGRVATEIAKEAEFDVIHAHDWLTYKAGIAAKKVSGKRLVIHVHATEFDRTGDNGGNEKIHEIERLGMQEADLIITVSAFTKKKIMRFYGVPEEKIRVVHNGAELEEYAFEEMYNLKKDRKVVLSLGRITLQKGIDYLVDAARKVVDHYPDVVFVIVGSGDMHDQIVRKVASLGLADKFIFPGWVTDRKEISKLYQMADLFLMPSVSEPFGLVVLEAMRNGTPSLISNQSGSGEILSNCLKTDFWDINDMADKIVSVLRYNKLHKCLQSNGKDEVKKITWDEPAKRCVDVYKELMEGKK